jgi:II/X family phage/plasmid replication protein
VIDWISAVVPCAHAAPIFGGEVVSVGPDGVLEWVSRKSVNVVGSSESGVQVRTCMRSVDPLTYIEFSGNPAKFLQGHNLFGSDDLLGLMFEALGKLAAHPGLGLEPSSTDRERWARGEYSLTRVDVTDSFALSSRKQVLAWLANAEHSAHLSHRGRGQLCKGTSLYFGKHSRRSTLKLYSKGQEVEAKPAHQPALRELPHARAWADPILRAELVLRGLELKRLELDRASAWDTADGVSFDPLELLRQRLGSMTMTTTRALSADVLETLRPALRAAVAAWESGHDLRSMFPKPTFYKYRAELLRHGIDIAALQPREMSALPMIPVLEAKPVGIPAWAVGTPLYFEPRARRVA